MGKKIGEIFLHSIIFRDKFTDIMTNKSKALKYKNHVEIHKRGDCFIFFYEN